MRPYFLKNHLQTKPIEITSWNSHKMCKTNGAKEQNQENFKFVYINRGPDENSFWAGVF